MILFDGHDLETLLVCGDPEIMILNSAPTYIDNDAKRGTTAIGRRWGASTVAFTVAVVGNAAERRDALSTLGAWLDVDEPKKLVLPDTPNRYYWAMPDGGLELTRGIKGEFGRISFTLTDPVAYGEEKSVTVPSGGSVTFTVGGTYRTRPRITANAVRNASSLVWGVRLDEGAFVHVATGAAAARSVDVDCDERTSIVNSSVQLPTIDSDWLEFTPGVHTLQMDNGTGAATVTWRERWL